MKFPSLVILLSLSLNLLSSCRCAKEKVKDTSATDGIDARYIDLPRVSLKKSAVILTPEQASAALASKFALKMGYVDNNGIFRDFVLEAYGVSLGGIDYLNSFQRDRLPKINALLAIRNLCLLATNHVITAMSEGKALNFEVVASIQDDRPYAEEDSGRSPSEVESVQAGEVRWQRQMDIWFWHLYDRGPTAEEMTLVRAAFLEAWRANTYFSPAAYSTIFYSMISSLEFWSY